MAGETFDEQLSRFDLMCEGDPTFDLSDNDIAALLAVRTEMRIMARSTLASQERIKELEAKLAALQRPFSDAEVVSEWPGASVAEAGLANAMLIRRIGWDKWPKEAIESTIKIDAERKRNPPVQP